MKKFQFSLGRVQNYKEQLLDREKNALMQLHAERQRTEDALEAARRLLAQLGEELTAETAKGITATGLKRFDLQLDAAHYHLERLEEQLVDVGQRIERQIQAVVAATQEVSSLEKLEEKQREVYRVEVAKDDELIISEFVSTKVIREQKAELPAT